MKWNEVKKHFNSFSRKALVAGLTAALLTGSVAGCGAADQTAGMEEAKIENQEQAQPEEDEELNKLLNTIQENTNQSNEEQGKEETVYLFADSEGNVTSTIVSGWLKNPDGQDVLTDRTELKDVVNIKGDETFSQDGEEYRWQAGGKDIYYQGTTTKEAPVTEKITYYLDGKEISPKELAGKSGKVKIRFDYENTQKMTAAVNGKEEEISVPFAVVTGMILNERFQNVSVENGRLVTDGKNNIVVGFALPGLKESLKLDEVETDGEDKEVEIPEYVEVSADVENFELDMTLTIATSSSDLSFDEALDFSDLDDKIDTLTDSSTQLADGTSELADGVLTLKDSLGEFVDGVATLKDGILEYTDGAAQLGDGIAEVKDGAESLDDGAGALAEGIDTLHNGARELKDGIDSAKDGAGQLADGINGANGAKSGAGQLAGGAAALKAGFDGSGDSSQPGAVAASRQVADGVAVLGSTVKDTMKQVIGMKNSLVASEVEVVKAVYESVGKGDVAAMINSSNVSQFAAGIEQIKDSIETEISNSVAAMVKQTAENAAKAAAQEASEKTKAAMEQEFEKKTDEIFKAGYEEGMKAAAELETEEGGNTDSGSKGEGSTGKDPASDSEGGSNSGNSGEGNNGSDSNSGSEGNGGSGSDSGSEGNGGSNSDSSSEDNGSSDSDSGSEENGGSGSDSGSEDNGGSDSDSSENNGGSGSDSSSEDNGGSGSDSSEDNGDSDSGSSSDSDSGISTQSDDAGEDADSSDGEQDNSVVETAFFGAGSTRSAGKLISLANASGKNYGLVYLAQEDGADQQAGAAEALQSGMDGLVRIGQAQGAVEAIEKILRQLDESGASMSAEQVAALEQQVDMLVIGASALADGIGQLSAGADALADGATALNAGMEALGSGANTLADGMNQLAEGGSTLQDGVDQLKSGSSELKSGTEKLKGGAGELMDGAEELTGHSAELNDGVEELADGTLQIVDGVGELSDGAGELLDGMLEFDEEGIQKIAEAYEGDVKSLTDRVKAVSDAGSSYDNFCGKAEGTKSSVKFILKTEAIKAE